MEPKKVERKHTVPRHLGHGYYLSCPTCGFDGLKEIAERCKADYCPECGQKLDWSHITDEDFLD